MKVLSLMLLLLVGVCLAEESTLSGFRRRGLHRVRPAVEARAGTGVTASMPIIRPIVTQAPRIERVTPPVVAPIQSKPIAPRRPIISSTKAPSSSKPLTSNSASSIRPISLNLDPPSKPISTNSDTSTKPVSSNSGSMSSPVTSKPVRATSKPAVPVYVPVKDVPKTTPAPKVADSEIRASPAKPSSSSSIKKVTVQEASEKKDEVKTDDSKEVAEREDEVAESKTGGFFSGLTLPVVASIGTAIAAGGLAYFMMPENQPKRIASRLGVSPPHGYDQGVRIVRPQDLTEEELERVMNAGAYRVNGRSLSTPAHPLYEYAKRVYKYVMPELLGGSSEESEEHEKIYIIRHPHHENHLTKTNEDEVEKSKGTKPAINTTEHPYHMMKKKTLSEK